MPVRPVVAVLMAAGSVIAAPLAQEAAKPAPAAKVDPRVDRLKSRGGRRR